MTNTGQPIATLRDTRIYAPGQLMHTIEVRGHHRTDYIDYIEEWSLRTSAFFKNDGQVWIVQAQTPKGLDADMMREVLDAFDGDAA